MVNTWHSAYENHSDRELILFIRRCDDCAFEELVKRYQEPVYKISYSFLKSKCFKGDCSGAAEEIRQEVL